MRKVSPGEKLVRAYFNVKSTTLTPFKAAVAAHIDAKINDAAWDGYSYAGGVFTNVAPMEAKYGPCPRRRK